MNLFTALSSCIYIEYFDPIAFFHLTILFANDCVIQRDLDVTWNRYGTSLFGGCVILSGFACMCKLYVQFSGVYWLQTKELAKSKLCAK